jgi:hydroxymethylglutaryl-CoA lyase
VRKISLADTVGLAQAPTVHDLFLACSRQFPELELGVHLHARPDRWEEVVMAAYSAGLPQFRWCVARHGWMPVCGRPLSWQHSDRRNDCAILPKWG